MTQHAETIQPSESLQEAMHYFSDEDRCIAYLAQVRWPDGVTCPTCGSDQVHYLAKQRRWKCKTKHAKQQFSVKVGTVMEDSPIPLTKWLPAMWMLANCKNGISSYELARDINVTQKTGWFMLHRIRLAMQDKTPEKRSGQVEVDESFIGGAARFMHKSAKAHKIMGCWQDSGHGSARAWEGGQEEPYPSHGPAEYPADQSAPGSAPAYRAWERNPHG